jgi:condensin complex subunit 2
MQAAPRLRQPSTQILDMPLDTRIPSDSATRVNTRIASSPGLPSAPLGNISNRVASNSTDDTMGRLDNRKPPRIGVASSDGSSSYDSNDGRSRIGSRTSLGGRRSLSGAKGGPSALRRLPPGAAPRSVVPSLNGTDDGTRDRVASGSRPTVAALARVNQAASGPRRSLGASINAAASGSMAQHDREVREVAKLNVDSTNFEEWMKMATDNKINATNTWNFALIDYFHDMSLLRSDNGDGSINFQKASCTLDGCVKVWTSRVDSVVVETGKLLSGLQDDGKESNSKSSRSKAGEDNDEDGGEEEDENGTIVKKKKSRAREPTLAKSFAALAVKKLDLEFTVDPLFKKTSADFDEGGAGGLLMNHLGVDSNARVVFDAGDVAGVGDDEQEEATPVIEEETGEEIEGDSPAFADQVDLLKIRNKLFSQHDAFGLDEEDAMGSLLADLVICPTFASFKFAPGDNTPFSALAADNADLTPPTFNRDYLPALEEFEGEDDFQNLPAFDDDDGQDDAFGNADPFGGGPTGYDDNVQDYDDGGMALGGREMIIPADAPIDFATAFKGITDEQGVDLNGDGFFDYFDQRLTKNWAGPEHWKMRNIGLGPPPAQRGDTSTGNGAAEKASRKSKEPFVVDFCSEAGAVVAKEIFEAPKAAATISLPIQKDASVIENYLLPEDHHFTSRQLLRLFIKPRAMLNLKRKGVMVVSDAMQDGAAHPADVDEAFWAQAAAVREGSREGGAGSDCADAEGGGMAYDTPFFEDDGGFDGMDDGAEGGMMDLDANGDDEELATQALKRIRPEFVNYAKKAKRVDVRKLKENIWKQLAIAAEKEDSDESEDEEENEDEDQTSTPRAAKLAARVSESLEPRVFQSVLSGLRKTYPKDRMDEISTSFCFICLLHLANEEGLEINTAERQGADMLNKMSRMNAVIDDEDDDARGEDRRGEERVGFLEQLSIVKDPNAGRSA